MQSSVRSQGRASCRHLDQVEIEKEQFQLELVEVA